MRGLWRRIILLSAFSLAVFGNVRIIMVKRLLFSDAVYTQSIVNAVPTFTANNTINQTSEEGAVAASILCVNHTNDTAIFYQTEVIADASKFWDSLWLDDPNIQCGKYKCLFRSLDQEHGEEREGYLIGRNSNEDRFEAEWHMAWKLAQYLQYKFGAKHLYLEEPQHVLVLPEALERFENQTRGKKRGPNRGESMYTSDQFAIIQRVRVAPKPNLIYTSRDHTFISSFYSKRTASESSYLIAVRAGVESALNAIQAVPLLANDFQIMIDSGGNVYQFDLDRAFLCSNCYRKGDFDKVFEIEYTKSLDSLQRMAKWSTRKIQKKNIDLRGEIRSTNNNDTSWDWNSVLRHQYLVRNREDNVRKSCKAMAAMRQMKGKKRSESKPMANDAQLMTLNLVEILIE